MRNTLTRNVTKPVIEFLSNKLAIAAWDDLYIIILIQMSTWENIQYFHDFLKSLHSRNFLQEILIIESCDDLNLLFLHISNILHYMSLFYIVFRISSFCLIFFLTHIALLTRSCNYFFTIVILLFFYSFHSFICALT